MYLKVVSKVLRDNLNDGVSDMFLADDLSIAPLDPNGMGAGTHPPISDDWISPFLGRSVDECHAALNEATTVGRHALLHYKFLVLDSQIKDGELVICIRWTAEQHANAVEEVYENTMDDERDTEDDRRQNREDREGFLADIPSPGIKELPIPQQDAATYLNLRCSTQWQDDFNGYQNLLGGYHRDQEWYERMIEEWQAKRKSSLPIREQ